MLMSHARGFLSKAMPGPESHPASTTESLCAPVSLFEVGNEKRFLHRLALG